jgi:hypothetical protein
MSAWILWAGIFVKELTRPMVVHWMEEGGGSHGRRLRDGGGVLGLRSHLSVGQLPFCSHASLNMAAVDFSRTYWFVFRSSSS